MDWQKVRALARRAPGALADLVESARRTLPVAKEALKSAEELLEGLDKLAEVGRAVREGRLKVRAEVEPEAGLRGATPPPSSRQSPHPPHRG